MGENQVKRDDAALISAAPFSRCENGGVREGVPLSLSLSRFYENISSRISSRIRLPLPFSRDRGGNEAWNVR